MAHTYDISGNYDVKLTNYLTVPELNHEYKIENTGLNTSSDMFIVSDGNGLTALKPSQMKDMFQPSGEMETKTAEASQDFKFEITGVSRRTADPLDRYAVVIPAGRKVALELGEAAENVEYLKFPLQTEKMEIQDGAFKGMKNLISAYIPPYVTSIGKDAFGGCFSLEKLFVPARLSSSMKEALGRNFIDGLVEYYNRPSKTDLPEKTSPVKARHVRPSRRAPEHPVLFSSTNCPEPQPDVAKPADYEVVLNFEKMSKGTCNYENEPIDDGSKTLEKKTEKYNIVPRFEAKGYKVRFEIPPEAGEDAFTGIKGTFAQSMLDKYNDEIMEWINAEIDSMNRTRRAHYNYQTIDGHPMDPKLPPEEYRQLAEQYL